MRIKAKTWDCMISTKWTEYAPSLRGFVKTILDAKIDFLPLWNVNIEISTKTQAQF